MANNPHIELTSSYEICASHKLAHPQWDEKKNREVFGKCADLHGHQYKIEVTLSGPVSPETGMLINGFEVDRIVGEAITHQLDHKHLNDLPFFKENLPTAEWIAVWVFRRLQNVFPRECQLKRVRVFETPSLYTEFTG